MKTFDDSILSIRRNRAAANLDQALAAGEFVLVFCGDPIQKPGGLDQTYPFLPHPDYFWLTGLRRQSGVSVYSNDSGWVDFILPLTTSEKVWEGGTASPIGRNITDLKNWLTAQKPTKTWVLGQPSLEQRTSLQPSDSKHRGVIQESFNKARRIKDAAEVQLIQKAAQIAAKGYARLKDYIQPGVTERQIQIEFESEVLRAGAEKFPYDTIVGTGTNSAVLHAIPTNRLVEKGDLILIDAGVDLQDYCVDITRMFAANRTFTTQQKQIYDLVLSAQTTCIEKCRPGVEWSEIHRTAAYVMAAGLKDLNILKGEVDGALETTAIATFFPHGVGHMVGQRVRDVGGNPNKKTIASCGANLRVDLLMEENFIMTVEPGLYFIAALIDDPKNRERFKEQINWSEVEKWRNFGGIRLEDDILFTANDAQNLTGLIPK